MPGLLALNAIGPAARLPSRSQRLPAEPAGSLALVETLQSALSSGSSTDREEAPARRTHLRLLPLRAPRLVPAPAPAPSRAQRAAAGLAPEARGSSHPARRLAPALGRGSARAGGRAGERERAQRGRRALRSGGGMGAGTGAGCGSPAFCPARGAGGDRASQPLLSAGRRSPQPAQLASAPL